MKVEIPTAINTLLALAIGAMSVLLMIATADRSEAQITIKKLEAEARTAWGKYHNYSEEVEDLLEAARSEKTLELWTVQGKLDACLKDKK